MTEADLGALRDSPADYVKVAISDIDGILRGKYLDKAKFLSSIDGGFGVGDVVCKSMGSSNPYNMVRAIFDGLKNQQSPRMVAQRRGRSVTDIIARREGQKGEQASAS